MIFAAVVAGLATTAASRVSILTVDLPDRRETLVVKRSAVPALRFLDSAEAVCRRQPPGSPLRSIYLGDAFCQQAVALAVDVGGDAVRLRLPFSPALHALATR